MSAARAALTDTGPPRSLLELNLDNLTLILTNSFLQIDNDKITFPFYK